MSTSAESSVAPPSRLVDAGAPPEAARAQLAAAGVEVGIVIRDGCIRGFVHLDDLVPAPWQGGDDAPAGERLAPPGRILWIG